MKFGSIPIDAAEGAILAHSLQTRAGIIKKGRPLSSSDIAKLREARFTEILAARLEPSDVPEDEAAATVAAAVADAGVRLAEPFTGRCNIYAQAPGIALLDVPRLQELNRIDEAITIATVAPFERVEAGQMVATVKVIPFAVPRTVVDKALELAAPASNASLVSVAPFKPKRVGLVLTRLPNTKNSVLNKRERVMADRLSALGSTLAETVAVPHETQAVRAAIEEMARHGHDPILVFAASAIVDRGDVIPAAVVAAGGRVIHLGMPVDPGNLLMTGVLASTDVIGVPSCAGSPKLNGFDWVLERRMADLPVGSAEIAAMGVGGLLKEIAARPQPREGDEEAAGDTARREPRIACIILAAGRSSRMGPRNKLTETLDGKPVVRHVAEAALVSRARPVVVVTGHQASSVAGALAGLDVTIVENSDFSQGMSTSLKAGIAALPALAGGKLDGAIVALGDMPEITPAHLDRMISAFAPKEGRSIVVPVFEGRRGNPVLWDAKFFPDLASMSGDVGARSVIAAHPDAVVELDLKTGAILVDLDTPEALAEARSRAAKMR